MRLTLVFFAKVTHKQPLDYGDFFGWCASAIIPVVLYNLEQGEVGNG